MGCGKWLQQISDKGLISINSVELHEMDDNQLFITKTNGNFSISTQYLGLAFIYIHFFWGGGGGFHILTRKRQTTY